MFVGSEVGRTNVCLGNGCDETFFDPIPLRIEVAERGVGDACFTAGLDMSLQISNLVYQSNESFAENASCEPSFGIEGGSF